PPTANLLSKPFVNQKKEERKCPSSPKLACGRLIQEDVIEIRDSESEEEATPAEKLPKDRVIKNSSSQKDIENGSSHKEKNPSVSSCKRRRMVVSSDSEDDDRIPIGKLKMKKHEEVHHHSDSFGNQNFMASIVSSGVDRSRKAEKISLKPFETDGTSSKKVGRPVAENTNENDVEEVGLDAEGRSLGEYGKKCSDAPDLTKIISGIRSWKANGLKWQYEVEMVSSFETDPSVCMRAVCALYRQHTIEKKAVAAPGHSRNRGFCRIDEQRGTLLAEFLLGGNLDGEMKKSVEELKRYLPSGIDECKRLAKKYSEQLFTVYRSKEDPFFC
ncbi:Homeobox-leucine zipper hox24, partial [Thalictrum thalictroides]